MLISSLTYLLISNALSLRKDKSTMFSSIVMVISNILIWNALSLSTDKSILFSTIMMSLILTSFLAFNNLFVMSLDKGIGIYGGLFHVTAFTQSFNIFIFIINAIILTLTIFLDIYNVFVISIFIYIPNEWFSIANILTLFVK